MIYIYNYVYINKIYNIYIFIYITYIIYIIYIQHSKNLMISIRRSLEVTKANDSRGISEAGGDI